MNARNGDKFAKLWNGDPADHSSRSEADLALASALAFWVGPYPDRIENIIEWCYALPMAICFILIAWLFRQTGFRLKPEISV